MKLNDKDEQKAQELASLCFKAYKKLTKGLIKKGNKLDKNRVKVTYDKNNK